MGLAGLRSGSSEEECSRKNRKFEKKLQFYAKIRDMVASLHAKKTISKKKKLRNRQKKLKAYDLSSLAEFLPELKAPRQPAPETNFKLNSKSRRKLVEKEGEQLRKVLNHPAFQTDPLSAIHQHLQSTQPVQIESPVKTLKKTTRKTKRKRSKASSGAKSMEI
ncbi:PREDICTED: uncharacterized protein LOC104588134 isoform X2 [Nelumbo nucifera]|uniref:Uncharacterized protein LOC104588134 isoform X2 n=2 Tax=Nelumbo nucifera TaxID=4432 RepID=A0A1U7ZAM8_NELNU|nr:PREDICTED: uncharacterized protein LOC104588134 isoform X2 [Nelumbo nucifera]DAD21439.1 TPA_asm: hypothetical protein HUJ06_022902 [Nelumbo nucifera]